MQARRRVGGRKLLEVWESQLGGLVLLECSNSVEGGRRGASGPIVASSSEEKSS